MSNLAILMAICCVAKHFMMAAHLRRGGAVARRPVTMRSDVALYSYADNIDTWTEVLSDDYDWEEVASSSTGVYLLASSAVHGTMLSTNSGASWKVPDSAFLPQEMGAVAMSSSGEYMIAGACTGYIYYSSTYGASWTAYESYSYCWTSMSMQANGRIAVAGAENFLLFISYNYGETWATLNVNTAVWTSVAIASNSSYIVAAAEDNGVFVSSNLGAVFTLAIAGADYWRGVACSQDGQLMFAVVEEGYIYQSTNYGDTFSMVLLSPYNYWTDISCSSTCEIVAATSEYSVIYLSTDFGVSWYESTSPDLQWSSIAATADGSRFIAAAYTTGLYIGTLSVAPSVAPTVAPTRAPTAPTVSPSVAPSLGPTMFPTLAPTPSPSVFPTLAPSQLPTIAPTIGPSQSPTISPSMAPSEIPTLAPSPAPSQFPTLAPSIGPSKEPSLAPSHHPTRVPTFAPTSTSYMTYLTNVSLANVSAATLDPASQQALATTTAECSGLPQNDVIFVSACDAVPETGFALQDVVYTMIATMQISVDCTSDTEAFDYYKTYTGVLQEDIDTGVYTAVLQSSSALYAATATADAEAVGCSFSEYEFISTVPTMSPTAAPADDKTEFSLLAIAVTAPAVLMFIVVIAVLSLRNAHVAALNQLNSLVAELVDIMVKSLVVYLSLTLMISYSSAAVGSVSFVAFILLLVSKVLVAMLWLLVVVLVMRPSRDDMRARALTDSSEVMERSTTSMKRGPRLFLVLLLYKDALKTKLEVTMISLLVTVSVFDITLFRLLPWVRTDHTTAMQGFPTLLTMRCCLYGTFASHFIQSIAMILRISVENSSGESMSEKQQQEAYLLLAFTIFNVIRSSVSLMLAIQVVNTDKAKLVVVNEQDVNALADFVVATKSMPNPPSAPGSSPGSVKKTFMTPGLISQMLFHGSKSIHSGSVNGKETTVTGNPIQSADERSRSSEVAQPPPVPAFIGRDHRMSSAEVSSLSGLSDPGELDDRGIRFSTAHPYADETVDVLRFQLQKAGKVPVQFMPLDQLQGEIAGIFNAANQGLPFDEGRLDYLLLCLDCNPEYRIQKEQETLRWRAENEAFLQESLMTMRGYVPPHIFRASQQSLEEEDGLSPALAKRLLAKKCLWLLRLNSKDIGRLHIAELNGRFNPAAQGLDVVEAAALFACLPPTFSLDSDGKKERWRASMEQQVKDLLVQLQKGTLPNPKRRNPVYASQPPQFISRESLHVMNTAAALQHDHPRDSFKLLTVPRQTVAGMPGTPGFPSNVGKEEVVEEVQDDSSMSRVAYGRKMMMQNSAASSAANSTQSSTRRQSQKSTVAGAETKEGDGAVPGEKVHISRASFHKPQQQSEAGGRPLRDAISAALMRRTSARMSFRATETAKSSAPTDDL